MLQLEEPLSSFSFVCTQKFCASHRITINNSATTLTEKLLQSRQADLSPLLVQLYIAKGSANTFMNSRRFFAFYIFRVAESFNPILHVTISSGSVIVSWPISGAVHGGLAVDHRASSLITDIHGRFWGP